MNEVRLSPEAGLSEIYAYIAQRNPEAAERLLAAVTEQMRMLAQHPRIGRAREELAPNLRSFPVEKYLIFFRPMDDGIEVVRVLHGARDIPALFN